MSRRSLFDLITNKDESAALIFTKMAPSPPVRPLYRFGTHSHMPQDNLQTQVAAVKLSEMKNVQWVRIQVQDTGVGMTPDVLATLFQPFVQGTSQISYKYSGTGLGLAISKRLCGEHLRVVHSHEVKFASKA